MAGRDPTLRRRLYGDVRFADDLDEEERARYQAANSGADRYAGALERCFVPRAHRPSPRPSCAGSIGWSLPDKLGHIARLD